MSKYVPPWYSAEMLIGAGLTYLTQYFFYFQPGVDRHAVMRWLLETFPDPVHSCILTTFCILLLLPAVIISVYGVLYHFEWSIFERYRVENWDHVGWNDPDPEKRAAYQELNSRSLRTFMKKQFAVFLFLTLCWIVSDKVLGQWPATRKQLIIDTVPDAYTSIWQIAVGLVIFETIFYWGHRVQHWYFYASHKIHHEYNNPNVLTAPHGDDADGWVTLFLPGLLPCILMQYHMYTFLMWSLIHYAHTYLDHSGYEFPYSPLQLIPFSGYVRAHDFHHTANVCNYGLYWTFWDRIMGTNKEWLEHEAKRELRWSSPAAAAAGSDSPKSK